MTPTPRFPGRRWARCCSARPDELATPFDIYESELEGTNANIVLQATNSISSTDAFAVADHRRQLAHDADAQRRRATTRHVASRRASTSRASRSRPRARATSRSRPGTGSDDERATADIEVRRPHHGRRRRHRFDRGRRDRGRRRDHRGRRGAVDGGAGGAIALTASDADQIGDSDVTTGVLTASGGDGGTGAGGRGGNVTVRSIGDGRRRSAGRGNATSDARRRRDHVAGIDTTGGTEHERAAGPAAPVAINTHRRTRSPRPGTIDSSGGAGGTTGGNAGSIAINTRDANGGTRHRARDHRGADRARRERRERRRRPRRHDQREHAPVDRDHGRDAIRARTRSPQAGATSRSPRSIRAAATAPRAMADSGGNVTVATESGNVSTGRDRHHGRTGTNAADTRARRVAAARSPLRAGTAEDATSDLRLLGNIDAREGDERRPPTRPSSTAAP